MHYVVPLRGHARWHYVRLRGKRGQGVSYASVAFIARIVMRRLPALDSIFLNDRLARAKLRVLS